MPNEGNSAAFREFGWRFTNIVARALFAMGQRPSYDLITRYMTNMDPLFLDYCRQWLARVEPAWEQDVTARVARMSERDIPNSMKGRAKEVVALIQFIREKGLCDGVVDGLISAINYDRTYFDKITASLLPLMEKLISGRIGELISPNYEDMADTRPIFEWLDVIKRKGIVYVGLDALSDFTVSAAVGNSMFADLVAIAGHIYKHGVDAGVPEAVRDRNKPKISIHADEVNELMGNEFIPLLNKAGGAGVQVTAYTQTWSDIVARLGDSAKAGQVMGNFNSLIMLRVRELETAELLTKQLPEVQVHSMTLVSGVTDTSDTTLDVDFTSTNQDRINVNDVPMLAPADLIALPKGQAFCLLQGGQLWKVRFPLPDTSADPVMPADVRQVAQGMLDKYSTADQWWVGADPLAGSSHG